MNTNFFTELDALAKGKFILTIDNTVLEDKIVVTVLFKEEGSPDPALHAIPPKTLKAPAAEMNELFFETITQPVQQVAEVFANSKNLSKQVEKLKKEQAEKKKSVTAQTAKNPLAPELAANVEIIDPGNSKAEKEFEKRMKQVKELAANGSVRQAYAKVPGINEFPDFQDQIEATKAELYSKFNNQTEIKFQENGKDNSGN